MAEERTVQAARRHPRRRRGRLQPPHGRRRGRDARRARAHRRELIDPTIAEHQRPHRQDHRRRHPRRVRSVVDAVRCAVEIQQRHGERNAGVAARPAHPVSHRHQRRRRDGRGRRHLWRRRQHRRAARRHSPSPAGSASPRRVPSRSRGKLADRLRTTSASSS